MKPTTQLFLILGSVICWQPTVHYLIATIAKKEIESSKDAKAASLVKSLEPLLKILGSFTKEDSNAFIEAAAFSDEIKFHSWHIFNAWHHTDDLIFGRGVDRKPYKNVYRNRQSLNFAISEAKSMLQNTKASAVDDRLGKSFMLRMLIHLVGDAHQPLHNVSFVDGNHPKGDRGGTLFAIKSDIAKDLHSLWDTAFGLFPKVTAPISKEQMKELDKTADDLIKAYSRKYFGDRVDVADLPKWHAESKKIAIEAYKGLVQNKELPKNYITDMTTPLKEQITIAGFRLADTLIKVFSDEETLKPHRNDGANDEEEGSEISPFSEEDEDSSKSSKKKSSSGKSTTDTDSDTKKAVPKPAKDTKPDSTEKKKTAKKPVVESTFESDTEIEVEKKLKDKLPKKNGPKVLKNFEEEKIVITSPKKRVRATLPKPHKNPVEIDDYDEFPPLKPKRRNRLSKGDEDYTTGSDEELDDDRRLAV